MSGIQIKNVFIEMRGDSKRIGSVLSNPHLVAISMPTFQLLSGGFCPENIDNSLHDSEFYYNFFIRFRKIMPLVAG